ncbi:EamA family transporter [Geminocystis sp. GBBB08]|uniref:EamA family transporter n=1 Tax=Geminocystis sp. GBBB08 TaxID=2604140 RepID=UPI0037BFA52F
MLMKMSSLNLFNVSLIILSIICSSTAQIMLKIGTNRIGNQISNIVDFFLKAASTPQIIAGVSLHVGALLFWLLALRRVDVSYAYPFISLGFVFVMFMSAIWLRETVSLDRIIGVILILMGIIYVARS